MKVKRLRERQVTGECRAGGGASEEVERFEGWLGEGGRRLFYNKIHDTHTLTRTHKHMIDMD